MSVHTPTLVVLNVGHSIHIANPFWIPKLWPLCQPSRGSSEYYVPPLLSCTKSDAPEATCSNCRGRWHEMIEYDKAWSLRARPEPAVVYPEGSFEYIAETSSSDYDAGVAIYECQECFALVREYSLESHFTATHPDKVAGKLESDNV